MSIAVLSLKQPIIPDQEKDGRMRNNDILLILEFNLESTALDIHRYIAFLGLQWNIF